MRLGGRAATCTPSCLPGLRQRGGGHRQDSLRDRRRARRTADTDRTFQQEAQLSPRDRAMRHVN